MATTDSSNSVEELSEDVSQSDVLATVLNESVNDATNTTNGVGRRLRTGTCFSSPQAPRTVVAGAWRDHDPKSLPEPFRHGFLQWALFQKRVSGQPRRPTGEAENIYNNRLLRFWKAATDYSRFALDTDRNNSTAAQAERTSRVTAQAANRVGNGHESNSSSSSNQVAYYWTSPQRPYSCPPHHF